MTWVLVPHTQGLSTAFPPVQAFLTDSSISILVGSENSLLPEKLTRKRGEPAVALEKVFSRPFVDRPPSGGFRCTTELLFPPCVC